MRKLLLGLFFSLFAQAAFAQAPSSLPGCVYNATPPTLADRQQTVWQCDINGKLITSGGGGNAAAVIGPTGAPTPGTVTNDAIVRWDGTTGTLVQNSRLIGSDIGSLLLGGADAAAPDAQTLSVQNVVAGTANTAGASLTIAGSRGTGTGAGGAINFQIAPLGGAGSTQNALATALTIASTGVVTVPGTTGPQFIVGSGGVNTGVPYIIINGGSSSGGGPSMAFQRNGTAIAYIGSYSADVGGASSDFYIHTTGSGNAVFGLGGGLVQMMNATINGFTALLLGPSGTAYPRLSPTGTAGVLEVKLADDSTYSPIAARGIIARGAVPTLALAGGTCAGTAIAGGSTAGTVTLTGVCGATNTLTLSVMPTAPVGYACDATDRTLGTVALAQTGTSTTTAVFTFLATTGGTDVLSYKCIAY